MGSFTTKTNDLVKIIYRFTERCHHKSIRQAISEGFDRIEHLKRYTTNSMGTDQGKISSINALGIVSDLLDKKVNEVGTTIYRPPYAL